MFEKQEGCKRLSVISIWFCVIYAFLQTFWAFWKNCSSGCYVYFWRTGAWNSANAHKSDRFRHQCCSPADQLTAASSHELDAKATKLSAYLRRSSAFVLFKRSRRSRQSTSRWKKQDGLIRSPLVSLTTAICSKRFSAALKQGMICSCLRRAPHQPGPVVSSQETLNLPRDSSQKNLERLFDAWTPIKNLCLSTIRGMLLFSSGSLPKCFTLHRSWPTR